MKKLLALVLALVMTLGLATVGANAALSDYSDGKDVSYTEAMSVMNAVGVFQGSDGKLTPKDELTRAQAAKLIAYLDMGETAAETLPAVQVFADVPATHWASKYIAYCYNAGIIKGAEANKFYPENNVTGYAFGVWLLAVLGYDRDIEGMNGPDWQIRTAALMGETGIGEHVEKAGSVSLTREEAAQYCLESLTATMVGYATKGTDITMADGSTIKVGASAPAARTFLAGVTYNANAAGTAGTDGATLQLTEKLYGNKLKANAATDPMNRGGFNWVYKGEFVTFHNTDADYTYTVEKIDHTTPGTTDTVARFVTDTLKKDWSYSATANYGSGAGSIVTINGNDAYVAPNAAGSAVDVGDTIQFWMSETNVNQVVRVAVERPSVYTLSADPVTRTSPTRADTTQVMVPGVVGLSAYSDNNRTTNVTGYEGLAKGDVVLVTATASAHSDGLTYYYITKADSISGVATGKSGAGKILVGGKAYAGSELVAGMAATITAWDDYTNEYDFYLDAAGQIVKATQKTSNETLQYAYVLSAQYAASGSLGGSSGALMRLLFTDGTNTVVNVSKVNGQTPVSATATPGAKEFKWPVADNTYITTNGSMGFERFVTYKVDADGKYEIKTVTDSGAAVSTSFDTTGNGAGTFATQNNKANIIYASSDTDTTSVVANSSTIFLVNTKATGGNTAPKVTVYTGIANLPAIGTASATGASATVTGGAGQQASTAVISSGIAKFVYIDAATLTVNNVSSDYVYIPAQCADDDDVYNDEVYTYVPATSTVKEYYEYDAIVNGAPAKVKLDEKISTAGGGLGLDMVMAVNVIDSDGIIDASAMTTITNAQGVSLSGGTLKIGANAYTTNASTEYYYIDRTGAVSKVDTVTKDDSDWGYFIPTTSGGTTAKTVYVKQVITTGVAVTLTAKFNGANSTGTLVTSTATNGTNPSVNLGSAKAAGTILTVGSAAAAGSENCSVVISPSTQTVGAAGSYDFNVTITAEDGKTSISFVLTVNNS